MSSRKTGPSPRGVKSCTLTGQGFITFIPYILGLIDSERGVQIKIEVEKDI